MFITDFNISCGHSISFWMNYCRSASALIRSSPRMKRRCIFMVFQTAHHLSILLPRLPIVFRLRLWYITLSPIKSWGYKTCQKTYFEGYQYWVWWRYRRMCCTLLWAGSDGMGTTILCSPLAT